MAKNWTNYEGEMNVPEGTILEEDSLFDIRDDKWAHPELKEGWYSAGANCTPLYDPNASLEEKQARAAAQVDAIFKVMGVYDRDPADDPCTIDKYMAPGCPEEPDAEVEIYVYRPKDLKSKKAKCMYYVLGGALVMREPELYAISMLCEQYRCVLVLAKYRESYKAPYPAAINDCHAGYIWTLEHASEIGINPDNIMLYGASSGGHLALCLGFRLKRYGIIPKGIVTLMPQTDDRETDSLSNKVYTGIWDSLDQHNALMQYAGIQNFGSSRLGPEYVANRASIEDCVGYPPTFIFTVEFDPDRYNCTQFYNKLAEAKTFVEFVCWPGAHHMSSHLIGVNLPGECNEYGAVVKTVLEKAVNDCFNYDLRRPWVTEEKK